MTPEQLQAGLAALNEADPPDMNIPAFAGNTRHGCKKNRLSGAEGREISTAMEVREVYAYGWDGIKPITETDGSHELAIVYKAGRCKNKCGVTGRSNKGKIVTVADRPPMMGRVSRD